MASSIVDYLSSGLYNSPAACLKELINNSYDADATTVNVLVKPDADCIILEDNGDGITREQFIEHFSHVSDSVKREISDTTEGSRKKIGLIGIGFIAANEICEEMEIVSSVAGRADRMRVLVDFRTMRKPRRERSKDDGEYQKGDYSGVIEEEEVDAHYTRIFLNEVRGPAREILVSARKSPAIEGDSLSLYGRSEKSVVEVLAKRPRSWTDFDLYSQTMLAIGLNVPVKYGPSWTTPDLTKKVASFTKRAEDLDFSVLYDGTDLRKPIVLRPDDRGTLFKRISLSGKLVSADGYLYARHGTLFPEELNGVLIRIREAAVGEYDETFLGFPKTIGTLFQRWISCELYVSDELEQAMNIDRRTLRESHEVYLELQSMFHDEFTTFVNEVRSVLYEAPAADRRKEQAKSEAAKVRKVIGKERSTPVRPTPEKSGGDDGEPGADLWNRDDVDTNRAVQRQLLRKYSVSELYELVVSVADDVLSQKDRERFIAALSRRLRS